MLFLFRTNQVLYSILLILYTIVLRISYFITPYTTPATNDGFLSVFFKECLNSHYLLANTAIVFLISLQAILINNLTAKYRLFDEVTLFPGLFYIMLVSSISDFLPLSSILLGNTFLILAISALFATYKTPKCADAIFNIGFWIGTASLFYNAFVFFLLLAWFGLFSLRSFKAKESLIMLIGYLLPFGFALTYFFWIDQISIFWNTYFLAQFNLLDFNLDGGANYYKLLILGLFFLMGLFNGYSFNKSFKTRNYMNIIYLTLLISGITFLFQDNIRITHFLIIMIPLSILVAARFLSMSKTTAEFVHLFLFIGIILFQFKVFNL